VPTVSEFKEQARNYEQQGHLHKALAIYRHILQHLEGTPALLKVLPVYVKVGDLLLQQNQREEAVQFYEKAAEQYVEQGSAQRVSTLCAKIVRADQQRAGVDIAYARKLVGRGHLSAARDVLTHYAEDAGLRKVSEALDDLTGTAESEIRPMLEGLIDSLEQGERRSTERVAERVSLQIQRITDDMAGDLLGVSDAEEDAAGGAQGKPELTPHMIDLGFSKSPITSKKPVQQVDTLWRPSSDGVDYQPPPPLAEPPREIGGGEKLEIDTTVPLVPPEPPPAAHRAEAIPRPERPPRPRPRSWQPTPRKRGHSALVFAVVGFLLGALSGAALIWFLFP
jgi:hypothetical protein